VESLLSGEEIAIRYIRNDPMFTRSISHIFSDTAREYCQVSVLEAVPILHYIDKAMPTGEPSPPRSRRMANRMCVCTIVV
jgi:hypothetical protein